MIHIGFYRILGRIKGGGISKGDVIGFVNEVFLGAKGRIYIGNIIAVLCNIVGVDCNAVGVGQYFANNGIGHLNGVGSCACSGNGGLVRLGGAKVTFVEPHHIARRIRGQ